MNQQSIASLLATLVGEDKQLLETHISWVLLAGDYAWKIKKPVDFGFVDFSTLEKRHYFCDEELRLNGRLAPGMYLEVVTISGTPDKPVFTDCDDPQEYAVKMRRFAQQALLSNRLESLDNPLMDELAELVATFHQKIAVCGEACEYGSPESVLFPMLDNFTTIRGLGQTKPVIEQLELLEDWTRNRAESLAALLQRRKSNGYIRECHGDMHLGNMAYIEQQVVIFDGIEFNPDFRWIDTMNEVAFLLMDLHEKQLSGLAWRFLNRYLQETGDYPALALCDFYQAYRAMVRAKVAALSGNQEPAFSAYLKQALACTRKPEPRLIITHGLSGSGKSYASSRLAEQLGAIHLRSDVERKRLSGLAVLARTDSALQSGIYSQNQTVQTYEQLRLLASQLLEDGYSVIVDATFLGHAQRQLFQQLAAQRSVPFNILDMQAPEALLRQRIHERQQLALDPSEADESVLQAQLKNQQPLQADELSSVITLTPGQVIDIPGFLLE